MRAASERARDKEKEQVLGLERQVKDDEPKRQASGRDRAADRAQMCGTHKCHFNKQGVRRRLTFRKSTCAPSATALLVESYLSPPSERARLGLIPTYAP